MTKHKHHDSVDERMKRIGCWKVTAEIAGKPTFVHGYFSDTQQAANWIASMQYVVSAGIEPYSAD